jgi:hypothetical protein
MARNCIDFNLHADILGRHALKAAMVREARKAIFCKGRRADSLFWRCPSQFLLVED